MPESVITDEPLLRFFAFDHLPAGPLQDTSRWFAALAQRITRDIPRSAERTVALRKLLESKDAAVRAMLPEPVAEEAASV